MQHFLQEIENIVLSARKRLIKGPVGNKKSRGYGASHDFHGHRLYMPGDDIRKIDWKSYARTEDFYIREYTAERQMQVNIILDKSASMDFGEPNKWHMAQMVALGLSYLTLKQMDILSVFTLGDRLEVIREQMKGKKFFPELVPMIEKTVPDGCINIKSIMEWDRLGSGITFIISDFFVQDLAHVLDYLCSRGQEVVILQLLSPQELDPNYEKELKLVDIETGETRFIYLDKKTKELYQEKIRFFLEECKNLCECRDIKYVFCTTDTSPAAVVARGAGVV